MKERTEGITVTQDGEFTKLWLGEDPLNPETELLLKVHKEDSPALIATLKAHTGRATFSMEHQGNCVLIFKGRRDTAIGRGLSLPDDKNYLVTFCNLAYLPAIITILEGTN